MISTICNWRKGFDYCH